jgi:epoxyqueuosine reductase
LEAIASRLRTGGFRAVVVADSNALVDREAARRAGLGWYGKNANLLLPGAGSWFVLGSVITDAPLPPTDHRVGDGCGPCTRCLTGCPTGAIIEPGVIDAARCLAWLVQAPGDFPVGYREALGDRIYGCDDCQEVCPPNIRTSRVRAAAGATADGGSRYVDLAELLDGTDEELIARFGRWYIPRRDPRYLRRNALVVLGNIADPCHPDTDRWLRRYLADDDPMLRRHAAWAARRLGRDDLLDAVRQDPDPDVRAELAVPVTGRFGA